MKRFSGDFLELYQDLSKSPPCVTISWEGWEALAHRRYIPAELDLEGLKNDPKAVANLLNEAGDLVAGMFLESRDTGS
jgi:hypothetical protein